MEELEGKIEEIIFKNDTNSYVVALFMTDTNKLETIVGYLPFISSGDYLKLIGTYVEHQNYGLQFKVSSFEKKEPEGIEAIENYLIEGDFEGIGPVKARRIVKEFGKDTIDIIKNSPLELSKIKGITREQALLISDKFVQNLTNFELVKYLNNFDINTQNAEKVLNILGEDALSIIKENPYILVEILNRINFEKIDRVALNLGFDYEGKTRIKSGVKYVLEKMAIDGNSCIKYEDLIIYLERLLGVNENIIEDIIISMNAKEEIIIEDREDDTSWVYLNIYYHVEKQIVENIYELNKRKKEVIKNIKEEIEFVEKKENITLSQMQKEAIELINKNSISIITGGPGTGKTTIIKTIIDIFKSKNLKPVLCAPTGRAAKRMTEITGQEAKTLHRLLELAGIMEDIDVVSVEAKEIDADLVIVDEASMLDMFLANFLFKAVNIGTKLVLVGDVDQLPSVGPGTVLKDLINSKKIEVVQLDEIFRQAAKSKIVLNAHRINKGEYFYEGEEDLLDDFFYFEENNQNKELEQILDICTNSIKDFKSIENVQVISPTKKGMLGIKELNNILQSNLNKESRDKKEKKYGDIIFREHDRVMQIKNNYQITWYKDEEKGMGIFNGELGEIAKIYEENKELVVRFDDGKEAIYEFQNLEELELAYSITVHKSQGSEFDVVILAVSKASPMLLTRNLIYTAVTRAKKLLIIVGPKEVVKYMIKNNTSKKRNTGLKYKLEQIYEEK